MNREEVQKLLGGYATATLTPEEQQALFAAALDDQELFDALAREQSLRDLLRDPAAKAQVLSALDAARDVARVPWYRHGWWRPAAVATALAGIAVMAVVVTRKQAPKPQAVTVAELKSPAAAQGPGAGDRGPGTEPGAPVARRVKPLALPKREQAAAAAKDLPAPPVPAAAPPPPREEPAILAGSGKEVAAPPAAEPRLSKTETVEVQAQQAQQALPVMPLAQNQQLGQLGLRDTAAGSGGALDSRFLAPNARLLFYGNPVAADAISAAKAAKKTVAPERVRATAATLTGVAAFHLGVRYSVLRRQANGEMAEVGIETVLDAGEPVKLKLTPNDRGYLRVWEPGPNGALRSVASGTAQPLQPFEAALPDYRSSGTRQLYVQFTRDGKGEPLPTRASGNLIQTVADETEKATYVVNRVSDPAAQQLVVPITLNYK